ncbi:hypothetical protein SFRURICE_007845 [Spodoptera frugiperda]|nr:hypothetical protein SFRURICE_007845 [Spodoptera frugiperda]
MVTLGLNMRLISSLSSNMFWRRISIHGLFRLYKQETSCKNRPALGSVHCACHVVIAVSNYCAAMVGCLGSHVLYWQGDPTT